MISSGCLRAFGRPGKEWEVGEENKEVSFCSRLLSAGGDAVTLHCFSPNLPWQKQLLQQPDFYESHMAYFNDLYTPELHGEVGDLLRSPMSLYTYIFMHASQWVTVLVLRRSTDLIDSVSCNSVSYRGHM